MSSDDIAIRVRNLSKCYMLYDAPRDRLKQFILPRLQRSVGKPPKDYYHEFWAVRNVDLDVYKGETLGIVGRNGSGKSTFLQLVCGTLSPTSGEMTVNGRVAALLELGAGINPEFTGRENIYTSGAVLGMSRAEIDRQMDAIETFAGIGSFIDQPVKTYSSGMYARLAFSMAINVSPDILIVDEILSVGDEAFQRKCFARIEELKRNGVTILFVSHSAGTVIELCDRAVLMEDGERILTGVPKRVVSLYQRLLHAPKESVMEIQREIREVDERGGASTVANAGPSELDREMVFRTDELGAVDEAELDEGLKPESTVEYPSNGARIRDVHIEDQRGRRVNILVWGHSYRYCYTVDFFRRCHLVRFGMLVKTLSGVEISGQVSHPIGRGLDLVPTHTSMAVEFEFHNRLLPGTYFGNAGVVVNSDEGEIYAHRVLDAMMFRVKHRESGLSTGVVDLATSLRPGMIRVVRRDTNIMRADLGSAG